MASHLRAGHTCLLLLLLLLPIAAASSAPLGSCTAISHAGIDYLDANLTTTPGNTSHACCDACLAYNARPRSRYKCTVAVWHNPQNGNGECALKSTATQPFNSRRVIAMKATGPPAPPPAATFRFASIHTSHMVLQRAPARAQVWGFCDAGETGVDVSFDNTTYKATLSGDGSRWSVMLPPTAASLTATHTLAATSGRTGKATPVLKDILFGDVWVCSGQSNMAYSLNGSNGNAIVHPPVNNSAVEIPDMLNWPHVRLIRAGQHASATPAAELAPPNSGGSRPPTVGWSKPCPDDTVASCRSDFSNVCYFYGRNIHHLLQTKKGEGVPVGLIGTYWGGTADELWSSPDALRKCLDPATGPTGEDGQLWNGMIVPLLNTTIKGAVWYQGEADSGHPGGKYDAYNCTFPAMIADWRKKWSEGTKGQTADDFPFGFVQLNSVGNASVYDSPADDAVNGALSPHSGYAGLRWSQTASYGTAPNPSQPNVFMAVSLDTPDRPSPFHAPNGNFDKGFNVHSPFKQPVAARLARAGLSLVYGIDVDTTGPVATSVVQTSTRALVHVSNVGSAGGLRAPKAGVRGFEVLVAGRWMDVSVVGHTNNTLSLALDGAAINGTKMRYNWYSNPCGTGCFDCAAYVDVAPLGGLSGMEAFLPLAPFYLDIM